jgi:thymidylate kinase
MLPSIVAGTEELPLRSDRPLHIGFLGIDGIGKTSMARLLQAELESAGIAVQQVSWRDHVDADARPNVRAAFRELWVESWRLMFLGDGEDPVVPPSYDEFQGEGWEDRLISLNVPANMAAGPLAAAWLELAAQVLLYHEVIAPLRNSGVWVIEESYPLKFVMKELLAARALSREPRAQQEVATALELLPALFRPRAPDLGILVSGPVELAYQRRIAEAGETNSSEDLGQAGRKGRDGFVDLQSECDRRFREVAADESWLVYEMVDGPPEENFARLRELIRPALSRSAPAP